MAANKGRKKNRAGNIIHNSKPRRPTSGEAGLIKESGEDMQTHGLRWPITTFEMNLEAYADDFTDKVMGAYNQGEGGELPADSGVACSLIPPATGRFRDFSHIAPALPRFIPDNCVACMECVTLCPDTAILAKVAEPEEVAAIAEAVGQIEEDACQTDFAGQWVETAKFFQLPERKGEKGGLFAIYVDPTKCKGCGECVQVCGSHGALEMLVKTPEMVEHYRKLCGEMRSLPETPARFLAKNLPVDAMLKEDAAQLYVGGAGSCAGCGEATAIRMMLAITGEAYHRKDIGIVAATGCNTVFGSTYPYNPYRVTWTNSLFENAPAVAMGIRGRWNQTGGQHKRLWVLGGDGAMYDIGFQSLSRMLTSGMDIKVLVLDTQVYSNTGGQTSTASFPSQPAKMSPFGKSQHGKMEGRKEVANIALMHPGVYVAQTSTSFINHFARAVREANQFPGPALINVYATCQPEHEVPDEDSALQSRRAVNSRAFPMFVHDPRKGESLRQRLSLQGNPALSEDWSQDPETKAPYTFVEFAKSEGRFAKHFDANGAPSPELMAARDERLRNWHLLCELAGIGGFSG